MNGTDMLEYEKERQRLKALGFILRRPKGFRKNFRLDAYEDYRLGKTWDEAKLTIPIAEQYLEANAGPKGWKYAADMWTHESEWKEVKNANAG